MTATRKAPARRPRPRPELRMPYFYCTKPDCTYEYQPTGDYRWDSAPAAIADGWEYKSFDEKGYFIGEGWLCPGHRDYVPWWPQPAGRLALPAPDVPRPGCVPEASAAEVPMSGDRAAAGPGHPGIMPAALVDGVHIAVPYTELPPGHPRFPAPDATVSFAVTGETQPFARPHPNHGKPFTELEQEMARLDDAEDIQP